MQLPHTNGPLASPFGERAPRKDPAPTADSVHESTDTEVWPRTAELDEIQSEASEGALEAAREASLLTAIKSAQGKAFGVDVDAIVAWNLAAAPGASSRVQDLDPYLREEKLHEVTWPLGESQSVVADLVRVHVGHEKEVLRDKSERLREEYRELDEEWKEHCRFLDDLMDKRGPPPGDLYAVPNALPIITPGPQPTTPVTEEMLSSRAIRRRGVGDAVTTEAEFQEILAAMADTAAKDPNYRASKTTAVVPDMLPPKARLERYDDENDLVLDPLAFYDYGGTAEPIWTDEERTTFVRRYLNFPKQFGKIAEGISEKTASDCVLYYYRTKKEVDYKGMLASRRGVTKKKAIPIKKGGKSAALLADLDRTKPTVDKSGTPARGRDRNADKDKDKDDTGSNVGSVRRGRADAVRRGRKLLDSEDGVDSSEATSRAGSEAPSVTKSKMRLTLKTNAKRPRVSSLTDPLNAGTPDASTDPATPLDPSAAQAELLPPIKRARKTRKPMSVIGPDGLPLTEPGTPAGEVGSDKPSTTKRGATSSYWSVEEKKRLKELAAIHGADAKLIAARLPGKTERQVGNFLEGHRLELGLEPGKVVQNGSVSDQKVSPNWSQRNPLCPLADGMCFAQADQYLQTIGYVPSMYNLYANSPQMASEREFPRIPHAEPRLGVFPTTTPPTPPGANVAAMPAHESPVRTTISRPGGMRISALLNDEPVDEYKVKDIGAVDIASDGTVDEQDGMLRPSPRSAAPVPGPGLGPTYAQVAYERRLSNGSGAPPTVPQSSIPYDQPELDRYRSASTKPYLYESSPAHSPAWGPRRSETPTSHGYYPAPPHAQSSQPPRGAWESHASHAPHAQHAPAPHPHAAPAHGQHHSQPPPHTHAHGPSLGYFPPRPAEGYRQVPSDRPDRLAPPQEHYGHGHAHGHGHPSAPPPLHHHHSSAPGLQPPVPHQSGSYDRHDRHPDYRAYPPTSQSGSPAPPGPPRVISPAPGAGHPHGRASPGPGYGTLPPMQTQGQQ